MPLRRPLTETDLQRLDEPQLVTYMLAMRDDGEGAAATEAMWVFLYRRLDWIRRKLEVRMAPQVAEDQTMVVVERIAGSTFSGTSTGELVNWLKTIIARAIADYYRGPEGRQLDLDRQGSRTETEVGGHAEAGDEDPGFDLVAHRDVIDRVLATRSAVHRHAISLAEFEKEPAADVATATGLTAANVYQVVRRFRLDCRALMEDTR